LKNILVIYFTQTGQAKQAIDAVLKPFTENSNYKIHYERIQPTTPFPYPWKYSVFFDAFPENVQGIPCEIESIKVDPTINFDLVFIAYQPWFLSICRPMNSFLLSPEAKKIVKGKPVITLINCRNMWLNAQEKMKRHLKELGADLVGNITFVDKSSNLTSLVTVLAFELKGIKEKYLGIFPRYGVNDRDLDKASDTGKEIMRSLETNDFSSLQEKIIANDLVSVKGNLLLLEGRGKVLFPLYAKFITKKGGPGSNARRARVKIFGIVLPTAILILSPIITILSRLAPIVAAGKMKKEIDYYKHNTLRN
jgi:hypothetical protein